MEIELGTRVRHERRGTEYAVMGLGTLPMSPDLLTDGAEVVEDDGPHLLRRVSAPAGARVGVQVSGDPPNEDTVWVLYRALHGDPSAEYPEFWLRPLAEFEGRFAILG